MSLALRCRCGEVALALAEPQRAVRGACYCRDCRAYTYFLGRDAELRDAWGGTEIVAVLPSRLQIERGRERIACMSLSETGVLRWYARCCRSPLGNTPRDGAVPHVGLIPTCLLGSSDEIAAAFGPIRMRVFRASARGDAPKLGASALLAGARYLRETLVARASGARVNPFFASDLVTPIAAPSVLSAEERARWALAAE
ncbi:MAG: hypothetical protein FJ091_04350 [Deltaproteobacteria bacterium]|nr:hypothetical protein [Deltaproteobacteria bacterium]